MRWLILVLTSALQLAAAGASHRAHDWPTNKVVINLNGSEQLAVRRISNETNQHGSTWRGEIDATSEPVVLMRWKDGRFSGMFAYRGETYSVDRLTTVGGDVHAVAAAAPGKVPARSVTQHADANDIPVAARSLTAKMRPRPLAPVAASPATFVHVPPLSPQKRQELAAKKVTIDVMVLYTHKVASRYVQVETDLIGHSIEEANRSFVNSGIGNIKLRLVHSQEIGYDESGGEHFDHLYRMVDGVGAFVNVGALRDKKRADVVMLIVDDASSCGLATRVGADAEEAFAVVHHTCASLTYSLPHEIGHIIGARHDASLDRTASPFPYGHGYANGTKWRDIMSYKASCNGCPRLPFWSNPMIEINGEPAGTVFADNARVLLEQAQRVANFR